MKEKSGQPEDKLDYIAAGCGIILPHNKTMEFQHLICSGYRSVGSANSSITAARLDGDVIDSSAYAIQQYAEGSKIIPLCYITAKLKVMQLTAY
jgi:hypothetical protein